ncbi:MAG: kinase/pyrophosphorylase [Calditrichia bacterium]
MNYVFIVSDGTGGTAARALNAALTQFSGMDVTIERRTGVRSEEQISGVVQEAAETRGFIVHTLVTNELRDYMLNMGRLHNVETIDLMGPLLERLTRHLHVSPMEKPGLFSQLNADYFRRIETMEFALHHDDGLRVNDIKQAEIVLVGVSRTFKTPLSIYLAFKQWLVANVPIILGVEPPPILFDLPPGKVFGLTMDTRRLALLRSVRAQYLKNTVGDYADLDFVRREAVYALKIFDRSPKWPVINVTGKPIEEIASEILAIAKQMRDE